MAVRVSGHLKAAAGAAEDRDSFHVHGLDLA